MLVDSADEEDEVTREDMQPLADNPPNWNLFQSILFSSILLFNDFLVIITGILIRIACLIRVGACSLHPSQFPEGQTIGVSILQLFQYFLSSYSICWGRLNIRLSLYHLSVVLIFYEDFFRMRQRPLVRILVPLYGKVLPFDGLRFPTYL